MRSVGVVDEYAAGLRASRAQLAIFGQALRASLGGGQSLDRIRTRQGGLQQPPGPASLAAGLPDRISGEELHSS